MKRNKPRWKFVIFKIQVKYSTHIINYINAGHLCLDINTGIITVVRKDEKNMAGQYTVYIKELRILFLQENVIFLFRMKYKQ